MSARRLAARKSRLSMTAEVKRAMVDFRTAARVPVRSGLAGEVFGGLVAEGVP